MTPQEIFEYKNSWRADSWSSYIDPDADIWVKDWCRRNLPREEWSFVSNARQDDWHQIFFHFQSDWMGFKEAYNEKFRVKI